jgi:transcriptional regulator with XRE-family HTH domain
MVKASCAEVKPMDRETVREALKAFGIAQVELARATGLSEAAISRQLNGGLPLTENVTNAAEELLVERGAQVAGRILNWVELRRFTAAKRKGAVPHGDA